MKLHVLPNFYKDQNEMNYLRVLYQTRGVPIWLKGDSKVPERSCPLEVLEQSHLRKKLGNEVCINRTLFLELSTMSTTLG